MLKIYKRKAPSGRPKEGWKTATVDTTGSLTFNLKRTRSCDIRIRAQNNAGDSATTTFDAGEPTVTWDALAASLVSVPAHAGNTFLFKCPDGGTQYDVRILVFNAIGQNQWAATTNTPASTP